VTDRCKYQGPHNDECNETCSGWGWFDGMEVKSIDMCRVFKDDCEAVVHINECGPCQQQLGKEVAKMLSDYSVFGVWPVYGDVHHLPSIPHNPDNPGKVPQWRKVQNMTLAEKQAAMAPVKVEEEKPASLPFQLDDDDVERIVMMAHARKLAEKEPPGTFKKAMKELEDRIVQRLIEKEKL
jgi:hypothetical protein